MNMTFEIIVAVALLVIVAAIWFIIARRRQRPAVDPQQVVPPVPTPVPAPVVQFPQTGLTYWVRRWEDHIIVLSGPALATSGIIAGLDILTNSIIKTNAPIVGDVMGVVWAVCLMLTLDFQILTLGVRVQKIAASNTDKTSKFWSILLCIVLGLALSYVSLQMGAIFAKMLSDSTLTLNSAQLALGINANALIYERSGMVMLLIFLSGFLRDLDAGQMLVLQPNNVVPQQTAIQEESRITKLTESVEQLTTTVTTLATSAQQTMPQKSDHADLAETLKMIAEMNAQTLQSMQESNRETIQIVVQQINNFSVIVEEIVSARPGTPQLAQHADAQQDIVPEHPETVLSELVERVPGLASVIREDALKVIEMYQKGMKRTAIRNELGWGSTKYANIIQAIGNEIDAGHIELFSSMSDVAEPADDVVLLS